MSIVKGNGLVHGIDPNQVEGVVFDLGGVFLEGSVEHIVGFGTQVGLSEASWRTVGTELFLAGGDGPWDRLERAEITMGEFQTIVMEKLALHGVNIDLAVMRKFMNPRNMEGRLRPEIVEACQKLNERMPTALLTNNVLEWRDYWRSMLDVKGLFHEVIDSSEVGMRKPEERIYVLMEQKLNLRGEALLFIDDLGVNLKGARARGWQTLKYDDTAKVLQVLNAVIHLNGD